MAGRQYQNVSYGLNQPLNPENPTPIIAKRNPTTSDFAFPTTIWTNTTTNALYILASVSNNQANWVLLEVGGGAGIFANLTVTPGPISLTGTTAINVAGAALTQIGTAGTGQVRIGNTTGNTAVTGTLTASNGLIASAGGLTVTAGGATITGTTAINATGAATTSIGSAPGTGAVNIGNAIGNTVITGTLETTAGITADTGDIVATVGAVSANTTVTAGTGISSATGNITAAAGNVIATGAASGFVFGTSTIKILSGAGAPGIVAPKGSLYLRTDGTTVNDRAYIATNGAGAWTAITTAA